MLCWFLLHSKMNQHISPLFWISCQNESAYIPSFLDFLPKWTSIYPLCSGFPSKMNQHISPLFWISFQNEPAYIPSCLEFLPKWTSIYPLLFGFPSHLGPTEPWAAFPVTYRRFSLVICFIHMCIYVNPSLPIHSIPSFPLGVHMFVLYICVSISALQVGLSVHFF